jgi:protein-disulfide isomerase
MATKKELREERRQERLRAEADQAAAQQRKRRLQLGAGAVFLALVVVGVLIVVSQSGSDDGGGDAGQIAGADQVAAELQGLPQNGTTLGDPKAKVTVTEYGDLQCPVCAAFSADVLPQLLNDEVEPGNAKLEFKNFNIIGPQSKDAAAASLAAANQGAYFDFIELFYANQGAENSGYVTDDFLDAVAEGAGVSDLGRFNDDRVDPAIADQVAAVQDEAAQLGLNATPSFVVTGPGGSKTLVAPSLDQLRQAIGEVG